MQPGKDHQSKNDNPYSAPVVDSGQAWVPITGNSGYVRQVKPLCICMIIQGALEILVGIGWVVMAVFVPIAIMNQQGGGPQIPQNQQQTVRTILYVSYGGIGAVVMLVGALRVVAGWRGLYFRSHRLGLVSHFVGLLSFLGCYCLPTSIGVCVWGCIVYFKPEVKNAFRMGEQGYSTAEIEAGVQFPPNKP